MGLKRNTGHGRIQVIQIIFIGLLALALFHDQYDFSEAKSLIGGLFFVAINQTMLNMMGAILVFQAERPVFLREQANKMYSVGSYYLAKIVIESPILALTPMIFSIIIYFKIGLIITAGHFFLFYFVTFLLTQCAASFGYFISSLFNKAETAVAIAPVIMMPIILFGGQFANSGNIPAWISWFQYVSPIRYGLEAFVRNEFDSRTYNTTMLLYDFSSNRTLSIPNAFASAKQGSMNLTRYEVIQYPEANPVGFMSFDVGFWECIIILAALTIALRFLSFLFLKLLISRVQ